MTQENPKTAAAEAPPAPPQPVLSPADAALIDGFLQHLEMNRGRRRRTIEAYRMALMRLVEFMAGKPLASIQPLELEGFAGIWLHRRGVVAASRRPYVSALRGFYAWARQRGHVKANPAGELAHPKTAQPLPHALSLASAEKLMWAPDLSTFKGIRDAAMLGILIGCGVRVSGLIAMNESDLKAAEIEGKQRLVVRLTEKGEKTRELPLPREAEMMLRVYLDHDELRALDRGITTGNRPDKVLFVNMRNTRVPEHERRGEALRMTRHSVWRMIQWYGEKTGIPQEERHPHAFRHLFGVELDEDEVELLTRQKLMGHADPKSTSIYTSMSMRRKTRVLDASNPLGKIKSPVSELLKRL